MLDERYRARWCARLGSFASFDGSDPHRVDVLAGELLGRYVDHGDVESFALLCELTGPRVLRLAERIAECFDLPQPPELLVDDLRRTLFEQADPARLTFARAHFLAWARETLLIRSRRLDGLRSAVSDRLAGVGALPEGGPNRPQASQLTKYNLYKLYKK